MEEATHICIFPVGEVQAPLFPPSPHTTCWGCPGRPAGKTTQAMIRVHPPSLHICYFVISRPPGAAGPADACKYHAAFCPFPCSPAFQHHHQYALSSVRECITQSGLFSVASTVRWMAILCPNFSHHVCVIRATQVCARARVKVFAGAGPISCSKISGATVQRNDVPLGAQWESWLRVCRRKVQSQQNVIHAHYGLYWWAPMETPNLQGQEK